MSEIQNVAIVSHEVKKDEAKPFVTYNVKGLYWATPDHALMRVADRGVFYTVSTATRSWTVQRRYNDFCALHAELKSSTSKEPPAPLPPKHSFRWTRSIDDARVSC